MINRFLLEHKDFTDIPKEDMESIRQRDVKRLQLMEGYCRTTGCLRNYILAYFGEKRNEPCNSCGNCHREYTEIDMTEDAKRVVNCVWETKGRYGLSIILGTLLGANRARLKEIGASDYKTYGALQNRSESELRLLISQLIMDGYLIQTTDKYSVIRLGNIAPLKDEGTRILIRIHDDGKSKRPEHQVKIRGRKGTDSLTKAGYELFEILRQLRLAVAIEEGMPPYIIFSDKTLIDMSARVPRDKTSMLKVSGVGEAKYEKYGSRFIEAIIAYLEEHPDAVTSIEADEDDSGKNSAHNKKVKKPKEPFYLNPEDEEKFEYRDFSLLAEIRDELNRITSADNVKHIFGTDLFRLLTALGYVKEQQCEGRVIQTQTELGMSKGIAAAEKISKAGNTYTVLMYPQAVQKEIVEYYTEIGNKRTGRR